MPPIAANNYIGFQKTRGPAREAEEEDDDELNIEEMPTIAAFNFMVFQRGRGPTREAERMKMMMSQILKRCQLLPRLILSFLQKARGLTREVEEDEGDSPIEEMPIIPQFNFI